METGRLLRLMTLFMNWRELELSHRAGVRGAGHGRARGICPLVVVVGQLRPSQLVWVPGCVVQGARPASVLPLLQTLLLVTPAQ